MKYVASGLALILLATPVMAQSVGEKTGVNSALGLSPTTADFVKQAAISDMFEIQSSQVAQERGNASEKTFAATMIKDHRKTSEDLKSMVSSGDVKAELPTALDSSKQSEIDKLKSLKGADFSRPHVHPGALFTTVLSGTWWVGTGNKFDPANLTVPMKPGTFVTHYGNRVHWDGAKDEDVTLLIIGEGPMTTAPVDEAR